MRFVYFVAIFLCVSVGLLFEYLKTEDYPLKPIYVEKMAAAAPKWRAVLTGATGATGRHILGELLATKNWTVSSLGRRPAPIPEPFGLNAEEEEKAGTLKHHIVDFEKLEKYREVRVLILMSCQAQRFTFCLTGVQRCTGCVLGIGIHEKRCRWCCTFSTH
jgi:hypothetical protein